METMASQVLNSDPQMISQISTRNTKDIDDYFGHVVRRYGHLPFLDNALQALIAKVKRVLSPGSGPSHREIWTKYGQALRGLQAAISSSSWDGPEVLCATQVLALFEVNYDNLSPREDSHTCIGLTNRSPSSSTPKAWISGGDIYRVPHVSCK